MLKKILLTLVLVTFVFSVVSPSVVSAQEWWNPSLNEFIEKVNDPPDNEIFGERYTHAQVVWILATLVNILGGDFVECATQSDPVSCLEGLLSDSSNTNPGAIVSLAAMTEGVMTKKMASGTDYVAEKLDKFGIPSAYAQGYGYSKSLYPVQKLWQASRNAAYALMTIAVVILAFMVMMRARISPQAVVTVQSAIPQIIIALIFITFSYAIAGFMVDLAFLTQGLVASVVSFSGVSNSDPLYIFVRLNDGMGMIISYGLVFILESLSGSGVLARLLRVTIPGTEVNISAVLTPVDFVIAIILFVLLLIALFRIFWVILKTQVMLFMLVIASPFFAILGVAKPGGNVIGSWFKTVTAQLSVFVVVGLLILFAHIMFFSTGNAETLYVGGLPILDPIVDALFNPFGIDRGFIDSSTTDVGRLPSGYGSGNVSDIGFFVSIAVMLSIPGIANSIRELIQSGKTKGFAMGGDAGAAMGVGVGAAGGGASYLVGKDMIASEAALKHSTSPEDSARRMGEIGRRKAAQNVIGQVTRRFGGR